MEKKWHPSCTSDKPSPDKFFDEYFVSVYVEERTGDSIDQVSDFFQLDNTYFLLIYMYFGQTHIYEGRRLGSGHLFRLEPP